MIIISFRKSRDGKAELCINCRSTLSYFKFSAVRDLGLENGTNKILEYAGQRYKDYQGLIPERRFAERGLIDLAKKREEEYNEKLFDLNENIFFNRKRNEEKDEIERQKKKSHQVVTMLKMKKLNQYYFF